MITRVRIEALGKTEAEVKDEILDFIAEVRQSAQPGRPEWQEEGPLEVQTAKTGFWARYTIRRPSDINT